MPLHFNKNAGERYTEAQRQVIKQDVSADTAIRTFDISDEDDTRLLRHLAATRDIGKGMAAPDALSRNNVGNEDDKTSIRKSAAERAVKRGVSAREAVGTHELTHGNQIKTVRMAALEREMAQGKSAIEAAAIHELPTTDFIFRKAALRGAELDVAKRRGAEEALARNGVNNEADASKVFTKSLQQRKSAYFKSWLKGMRAEQTADFECAKASKTTRKRKFKPIEYEPVAAFVDLAGIGAKKLMDEGKAAPEIVAELKLSEQSHIAAIKSKCARRDFEGSCVKGQLAGKKVSAVYALRRNQVYDRDEAQRLLQEEVQRSAAEKARNWASARATGDTTSVAGNISGKRKLSEPVMSVKKLRSTPPTIQSPSHAATSDARQEQISGSKHDGAGRSQTNARPLENDRRKLDRRDRSQQLQRSS